MINGMYHTKKVWNHRTITIDICDLREFHSNYNTPYEVMVLRNCNALEEYHTADLDDAIRVYNEYLDKYTDKEPKAPAALSGKYIKLCDDLKAALAIGKEAQTGEDGGTCNFDAPSIELKGWKYKLIEQAAKEAGTSVMKWHLWGKTRYVFSPDTSAQGNDRSRNSDAMTKYLKSCGYDALEYSAMD